MAESYAFASCFIHQSAWKGNSANFAKTAFLEVRAAPASRPLIRSDRDCMLTLRAFSPRESEGYS
jgi:hypothetical protein